MFARFLRVQFFVAAAVLMSGCVAVPDQELTTYREAFLEAKSAGVLLYDELGAAVQRAGGGTQVNCSRTGPGAPECFDPRSVSDPGAAAAEPSIRARLLALEVVTLYNLAIVDLLEGKQGDALVERIGELQGLAKDLLAVAAISTGPLGALITGPALGLLGELVQRLDNIRARETAARSLRANAPTIRELIGLLINDTSRMYNLYRVSQASYAAELEIAAGANTPATQAAYAKIGAYHEQLGAYVKVLVQTRDSFDRLIATMESGAQGTANLRAVIREAIEIRSAADAFWNAVRKSR